MNEKTYSIGDVKSRVVYVERSTVLQCGKSDSLFVFDENTKKLFQPEELNSLSKRYLVLPPGEAQKELSSVEKILEGCVFEQLSRDSTIIGVGGGVICDITAFAASLYMRGCGLILVPTTLLAMVDASLGGKTGVDFRGYKNMVGTFYPAAEIRICTEFLLSLPETEYRNGLSEVLKHALLGNDHLLLLLKENREKVLTRDIALMSEVVAHSLDVKGAIVEKDFREQGGRAFLNFGHTFGHALETAGGFRAWSHGEAVAWGIRVAVSVGKALGVTSPGYFSMVNGLLDDYGYPVKAEGDISKIMEALVHDKKKRGGALRFVLQRDYGDTFLTEIDETLLRRVIGEHLFIR